MPPSSNAAFLQQLLWYSYTIEAAHENLPSHSRRAKGPWTEEDEKLAQEDPIASLKKAGCLVDDIILPTQEEIKEDADARSAAVISNWKALQEILGTHEHTIGRRWEKKSKKQRRALLIHAFPEISREHNPGFREMLRHNSKWQKKGRLFGHIPREALLWPHLNLEDLCQTKPLLLLLNARGRHRPKAFVEDDTAVLAFANAVGGLEMVLLHRCEMLFHDQESHPYTSLLEDVSKWSGRRGIWVGGGLQVLEIQEKTLSFLLAMSKLILHDVYDSTASDSTLPSQIGTLPILKDLGQASGETLSLPAIAIEAAYGLPTATNFKVLSNLAQSCAEAARHHIWDLRQDPGYFSEVVKELGSIPHPESKIPFLVARAMGRRLQRVYGWSRETFVTE